jgi:hypothetical protein
MNNGKIHYWLWFGLILTTLPLVLTFWKLRGVASPETTWYDTFKLVIARGELLLVCLSLLGVNLGDLFKDEYPNRTTGFTLMGATIFLSLFAVYAFGEINTNANIDKDFACNTSILMFVCSVAICLVSNFIPRTTK